MPAVNQPDSAAWRALRDHHTALGEFDVAGAFGADAGRYDSLHRSGAGLLLDLSKNRITAETVGLLIALADQCRLAQRIEALFTGAPINLTEGRPALHTALRDRGTQAIRIGTFDVRAAIAAERARLQAFVTALQSGSWRGYRGDTITDVVNLGIGGSDLGPKLVTDALRNDADTRCRLHFVANVDAGELHKTLARLDPARTLFIVASKSFTTPETLLNATTARGWLQAAAREAPAVGRHFVAVSANIPRAVEFGIDPGNVFAMWDWVGGRYSVWSSIGLPVMCAYGVEVFDRFLAGAWQMDQHFRSTPFIDNLPVLLALTGLWHAGVCRSESWAAIAYDDRLLHLPAYLQQLEMESNGKQVTNAGTPVNYPTAPVTWGGLGTNGQHAFFQLLHQGTRLIPIDFILPLRHPVAPRAHQDALVANCLAQSEALMLGRSYSRALAETSATITDPARADLIARHRQMPGNRPHNLIVMDELNATTLGALLALYEHKTYVQGVIWDINSFDQWGVELGKQLAADIEADFAAPSVRKHDESTARLIARYRKLSGRES